MTKGFKVSIKIWNTQYSTQQKANSWELFWPKATILKSKFAKWIYQKVTVPENKFHIQARINPENKFC